MARIAARRGGKRAVFRTRPGPKTWQLTVATAKPLINLDPWAT